MTYTYTPLNRPESVRDWSSRMIYYGYDAASRPLTATLPNGVGTSYTYDNANRLTRLSYTTGGGSVTLGDYAFAVDAVGNRTAITETLMIPEQGGARRVMSATLQIALPFVANQSQVALPTIQSSQQPILLPFISNGGVGQSEWSAVVPQGPAGREAGRDPKAMEPAIPNKAAMPTKPATPTRTAVPTKPAVPPNVATESRESPRRRAAAAGAGARRADAASAHEHERDRDDHVQLRSVVPLDGGELYGLDLPRPDKRLFTFVETDGCLVDGIAAATGCRVGNRTMRVIDYGKSAATFVDMLTKADIRIVPHPQVRTLAARYAPRALDRWQAQLSAYQDMPTDALLLAQKVTLTVSAAALIRQPGHRAVCEIRHSIVLSTPTDLS